MIDTTRRLNSEVVYPIYSTFLENVEWQEQSHIEEKKVPYGVVTIISDRERETETERTGYNMIY